MGVQGIRVGERGQGFRVSGFSKLMAHQPGIKRRFERFRVWGAPTWNPLRVLSGLGFGVHRPGIH